MNLRQVAVSAATHPWLGRVWKPLVRDRVAVLMFHRFAQAERCVAGHSVVQLRRDLESLRRQRIRIDALGEMLADGTPPAGNNLTVALTVDDGYADFADAAAPVFAEFDCPVTVFLVTGVIDDNTWFWWDRVEYAVTQTTHKSLDIELGGAPQRWSLQTHAERAAVIASITEAMKDVPTAARLAAIDLVALRLDVDVPATPPPQFAPMSWTDVRRCAGQGVAFAPHTITHPILPQTDHAMAEREIAGSWERLRSQCDRTEPVFCYPNGTYTDREVGMLAHTPLRAAVTTNPGYALRTAFASPDPAVRFGIPRFAYTGDRGQFAQIVTGFEQFKMQIRGTAPESARGG